MSKGADDDNYSSNDNSFEDQDSNNINHDGNKEMSNAQGFSQRKLKRNIRREPLHDIIFVESYKEYNANNANWYSN